MPATATTPPVPRREGGEGKVEDRPTDEAERARLRKRAVAWLRADLASWTKQAGSGPPQAKALVAPTLEHWKQDADLVGLRDEAGRQGRCREDERTACRAPLGRGRCPAGQEPTSVMAEIPSPPEPIGDPPMADANRCPNCGDAGPASGPKACALAVSCNKPWPDPAHTPPPLAVGLTLSLEPASSAPWPGSPSRSAAYLASCWVIPTSSRTWADRQTSLDRNARAGRTARPLPALRRDRPRRHGRRPAGPRRRPGQGPRRQGAARGAQGQARAGHAGSSRRRRSAASCSTRASCRSTRSAASPTAGRSSP